MICDGSFHFPIRLYFYCLFARTVYWMDTYGTSKYIFIIPLNILNFLFFWNNCITWNLKSCLFTMTHVSAIELSPQTFYPLDLETGFFFFFPFNSSRLSSQVVIICCCSFMRGKKSRAFRDQFPIDCCLTICQTKSGCVWGHKTIIPTDKR